MSHQVISCSQTLKCAFNSGQRERLQRRESDVVWRREAEADLKARPECTISKRFPPAAAKMSAQSFHHRWSLFQAVVRQTVPLDEGKRCSENCLPGNIAVCFSTFFNAAHALNVLICVYFFSFVRVTKNLPFRSHTMSPQECFQTFIKAIFYVGKGKRSRPYSHLYEALEYHRGDKTSKVSRVALISTAN